MISCVTAGLMGLVRAGVFRLESKTVLRCCVIPC